MTERLQELKADARRGRRAVEPDGESAVLAKIAALPQLEFVFTEGVLNVIGDGFDMLNGPYDAKVIGDFTGLVPPFEMDGDRDAR
jgi:hypothetical protein